jgi:hypothetical protein
MSSPLPLGGPHGRTHLTMEAAVGKGEFGLRGGRRGSRRAVETGNFLGREPAAATVGGDPDVFDALGGNTGRRS